MNVCRRCCFIFFLCEVETGFMFAHIWNISHSFYRSSSNRAEFVAELIAHMRQTEKQGQHGDAMRRVNRSSSQIAH